MARVAAAERRPQSQTPPYFPALTKSRAASSWVSMADWRWTMSPGGGWPLRMAASMSETRLWRSFMALCTLLHDSAGQPQAVEVATMLEFTLALRDDQASRSYGGLTNFPIPPPHTSLARSAMLIQELSEEAWAVDEEPEVFAFTHGKPYFQATKTTARTMIHL